MFYIGIDGGGTKTKFVLIDDNKNVINTIEKSTCHFMQVGFDGLEKVLYDGFHELIEGSDIRPNEIKSVCLGLAGYGNVVSVIDEIKKRVKNIFTGIDFILCNDVKIAHAGALGGKSGIVIISGTGSIGYSIKDGIENRIGGWGYQIGDEGSAYWIGKKTLEIFSKQADGRLEKKALYKILREELNIKNDYDIIKYVGDQIKGSRSEIAKFAQYCYKAAEDNDIDAIKIFDDAGFELAQIINALYRNYHDKKVNASYIGGVFKSKEMILKPLIKYLDADIELIEPKFSPEIGAALLAIGGD